MSSGDPYTLMSSGDPYTLMSSGDPYTLRWPLHPYVLRWPLHPYVLRWPLHPQVTLTPLCPQVTLTPSGDPYTLISSGDPYIHSLSVKCRWTLRMRGNRSGAAVALPADSPDVLVEQVCRDLGCGSVYRVKGTGSPPDARCFHDCSYRDGRLQNCSQRVGGNCTVIAEAICGEVSFNIHI